MENPFAVWNPPKPDNSLQQRQRAIPLLPEHILYAADGKLHLQHFTNCFPPSRLCSSTEEHILPFCQPNPPDEANSMGTCRQPLRKAASDRPALLKTNTRPKLRALHGGDKKIQPWPRKLWDPVCTASRFALPLQNLSSGAAATTWPAKEDTEMPPSLNPVLLDAYLPKTRASMGP